MEKYRPGLLGIAEGLGLGRGAAVPAGVSRGLLLVGGLAALDYGHPETTMNVDYPGPWYRQAMVNGHVHVMLGTALMKGTGAEGARDYLTAYYGTDAMWSGLVAWRRELPAPWLRLGKTT
ncbi:hypothetical protein ACFT54_10405 [Streptomyces cinereoruber]|uniref:hypothetical protein n=1 Tax=Streptomyces cinereoruber TaxID=67260 RepID=UPI00362D7687